MVITHATSQTTTSARSGGNSCPKNAERIFSFPVFSDTRITPTDKNKSRDRAGCIIITVTRRRMVVTGIGVRCWFHGKFTPHSDHRLVPGDNSGERLLRFGTMNGDYCSTPACLIIIIHDGGYTAIVNDECRSLRKEHQKEEDFFFKKQFPIQGFP